MRGKSVSFELEIRSKILGRHTYLLVALDDAFGPGFRRRIDLTKPISIDRMIQTRRAALLARMEISP